MNVRQIIIGAGILGVSGLVLAGCEWQPSQMWSKTTVETKQEIIASPTPSSSPGAETTESVLMELDTEAKQSTPTEFEADTLVDTKLGL